MNNKNWYYIIKFSGAIIELHIEPEQYQKILEQLAKGDLVMIKSLNGEPLMIAASGVSDVYAETDYLNWVESSGAKHFVKHGMWYSNNDRSQPYRIERWRQQQIDKVKKLEAETNPELTPAERERHAAKLAEIKADLAGKLKFKD